MLSVGLFVWLVASETRKQCSGTNMKPVAAAGNPLLLLRESGAWTSNPMAARVGVAAGRLPPRRVPGGGGAAATEGEEEGDACSGGLAGGPRGAT